MYVSEFNKEKAQKIVHRTIYISLFIIIPAMFIYFKYKPNDWDFFNFNNFINVFSWYFRKEVWTEHPTKAILLFNFSIGFLIYYIIANMLTPIFRGAKARSLQKAENKEKEKNQQLAIKQQEQREYREHRNILSRDMERKRAELELEFEHFKKMTLLKSSMDEGKLKLLAKMEHNLENAQASDLQKLDKQIQRMKRDL